MLNVLSRCPLYIKNFHICKNHIAYTVIINVILTACLVLNIPATACEKNKRINWNVIQTEIRRYV